MAHLLPLAARPPPPPRLPVAAVAQARAKLLTAVVGKGKGLLGWTKGDCATATIPFPISDHEGTFARHMPGAPSIQINVPAIYHNALPPNITPSSSPGTLSASTLYDCMTGDQLNSRFFAQQMGQSPAPYPCRPHHGQPPQNQRIPLLCVTDHSSGHIEEWASLTPTRGATPKRGKTLPGTPGALTYSPMSIRGDGATLHCGGSLGEEFCPNLDKPPKSLNSCLRKRKAPMGRSRGPFLPLYPLSSSLHCRPHCFASFRVSLGAAPPPATRTTEIGSDVGPGKPIKRPTGRGYGRSCCLCVNPSRIVLRVSGTFWGWEVNNKSGAGYAF